MLNNKDNSIIELIKNLEILFEPGKFEMVDYWDADLCAIGLLQGKKLVYICSFAYASEGIIKYDYDFEIRDKKIHDETEVIKRVRGVSTQALIEDVRDFLELKPRSP